jgi:hypothetical protein
VPGQINVENSNRSRRLRGVCGQPVRISRAIVTIRNFKKKYLKLVVEETIVLDGLRMLVPQFVDDKAQSFVVTSRFR